MIHAGSRPVTRSARRIARTIALRWLVPSVILLTLLPAEAFAQLRGLGGGSIGGVVGGAVGGIGAGSNIGVPGTGGLPSSSGSSNQITAPILNIPIDTPAPPRTDSVTGTVNNATGTVLAAPGAVTNTLGNTVNQATRATRNVAGPPGRRARSGAPPAGERRFVTDEVMVRLPSNLPATALDAIAQRHGLTRVESERIALTGTTFHRWRISGGRSVPDVIRALEAETGVGAAQPNYRFELMQQLRPPGRIGQEPVEQYALAKLSLPEAHRLATGGRVLIAVIDSGIDTAHPEIAGFVAASYDALNSTEPPHSHGTAMAGAIVAHSRLTGVAPAARILAIRAFGTTGSGAEGTTLTLLRAIDWAVAHGARIINMSFAGPSDPEIAQALTAARKKGVVLVAAAGNAGETSPPLFPASDSNVIAVTATDANDKLFKMANRGKHIAVAAPGVEIVAPAPNGGYQVSTGTSIAAAQVSGIAALLIERKPDLAPAAVRKALTATAIDLGPKGRDDQFGAGLANAYRAIQSIDAVAAAPRNATRNASATPPR